MWVQQKQKRGFFIEAGALDGETTSTTIFMERELEWEGVLVEANPESFTKIVSKHRKAWLVPAALSNSAYPKYTQCFRFDVFAVMLRFF